MQQLAKLTLWIYWYKKKPSPEKLELNHQVFYNPSEISIDKGTQIAEVAIPGLDSPLLQFVRGHNEKLSVDLFFDSTEQGMGEKSVSVTEETDKIYELVKIEPERHAPPICFLSWNEKFPGSNTTEKIGSDKRDGFKCVVESVKQKFTLFSPQGVPLRATLTVTFREYRSLEEQLARLNRTSPDRTHGHHLESNESLSSIATQYYDQPGAWRSIADENNIEDPRRLTTGQFLIIPPIT